MWSDPVDLLVQRFPGASALAASTILGESPSCVAVHARVLELVAAYDETLPFAARLRRAVPGPGTDLPVLLHLEALLRRLAPLLEELTERPRRARRLTSRLGAVLTTLETCPSPAPRVGGRRGRRPRLRRGRRPGGH
jgi:hypothetical protein